MLMMMSEVVRSAWVLGRMSHRGPREIDPPWWYDGPLPPLTYHRRDVDASSLRQRHSMMVGENPWEWNWIESSLQMRYRHRENVKSSCAFGGLGALVQVGIRCS